MRVERKHKHESFEAMMRRFKKSCEKSDIINEVKKREHLRNLLWGGELVERWLLRKNLGDRRIKK